MLLLAAGCSAPEEQSEQKENTPAPAPTQDPTATPEPTKAPEPTAEPEVKEDPAAVVLEMIARANAEDYAGAAELVADDMMAYFIGLPPTGMEIYWGKEQFETFLVECCTGQHFEWEVGPMTGKDHLVFAEAKTWMDFTRELGVAPNTWTEVYEVQDGLITLYTSTITEEALAKFRPALSAVMPEAFAVPPPSDEPPVSEITVTLANNTCSVDGSMNLKAGELTVNVDVQDKDWDKYAVTLFTLDDGKDMLDLMASTPGGPPEWTDMVFNKEFVTGDSETFKGTTVEEGPLYLICWAGTPDTPIGNAGPFYAMP
jgi:hypothetical protein